MSVGVRIRLHAVDGCAAGRPGAMEELWADGLARHGGPFLGGARFTAVDAFFAPVATRIQTYGLPVGAASRGRMSRRLLAVSGGAGVD